MATEKKLIDANELPLGKFVEPRSEYQIGWNDTLEAAAMQAPTVDAVEVVHGRWERTDYPEFCKGDFECSVCEHLECDIDTSILMPGVNCLYYCPNCGAKMDGGETQ